MKKNILPFFIFSVIFCSCNSENKIKDLESRVDSLNEELQIEKLEHKQFVRVQTDLFKWYPLGQNSFLNANEFLLISSLKTTFNNNGYTIEGNIVNFSSITITSIIIECATKDRTQNNKLIFGTSNIISNLSAGQSTLFSIFIPNSSQQLSEIGVRIKDYKIVWNSF